MAPEVGALVEVTLMGKVTGVSTMSPGLYIQSGEGFDAYSYWVPAGRPVKVLSPPLPREVLLLDCGHLTEGRSADQNPSPLDKAYCWLCRAQKYVRQVGRVER